MFDRGFDRYRWAWCALTGLLLVLGFAPFSCATAGWIALVPAWWAVTRSDEVRRKPMRYGYLVGLVYFGGTFWWISNVTAIGAFFLVLYLALYPAVWFLLVTRLIRGRITSVLMQALAAAALWVTLEWWRSWFLTGFDWNELGVSQAPSIIYRQLAAYGGVPLISFVLVMVNVLWAEGLLAMTATFREKRVIRASFPFAAALFIVAICFALGWHHLRRHRAETLSPDLHYACVQPNIPQIVDFGSREEFQKRMDNALEIHEKLTLQAIATKPDLLIWPEATMDGGVFDNRDINEAVHGICQSFPGYFLLGSSDFETSTRKLYNSAYFFGAGGDRFKEYRKTRLVILGEFLPFEGEHAWLRKQLGVGGMDFTPGPGPVKFDMDRPTVSLSPLICFEDTLASVADKAAQLKPDFFVTITNDGWYWGWCGAWGIRQHLSNAVFRCVEHDRSMIRCANNGISCQIDQNGTVATRFHDASGRAVDVSGVFTGTLQFYPPHATRHEAWGDWIILISSLATGILGLCFFVSLLTRSREP